jgi:hypothetical protein
LPDSPLKTARFLHLLFLANEFSNYRILTPPLRALPVPRGDFFRRANYPFLTPQKQDSEFRIQPSAWMQNGGVRNR